MPPNTKSNAKLTSMRINSPKNTGGSTRTTGGTIPEATRGYSWAEGRSQGRGWRRAEDSHALQVCPGSRFCHETRCNFSRQKCFCSEGRGLVGRRLHRTRQSALAAFCVCVYESVFFFFRLLRRRVRLDGLPLRPRGMWPLLRAYLFVLVPPVRLLDLLHSRPTPFYSLLLFARRSSPPPPPPPQSFSLFVSIERHRPEMLIKMNCL